MIIRTITGHRYNMTADILKPGQMVDDVNLENYGEYVVEQNFWTGEFVRVWKPYADLPTTPDINETVVLGRIPCMARSVVSGGTGAAGATERFGAEYEMVHFAHMWLPKHVQLSVRDRVTNIRNPRGEILWVDEPARNSNETPVATEFNVSGVQPLLNAFNHHTGYFVLLERADHVEEIEI